MSDERPVRRGLPREEPAQAPPAAAEPGAASAPAPRRGLPRVDGPPAAIADTAETSSAARAPALAASSAPSSPALPRRRARRAVLVGVGFVVLAVLVVLAARGLRGLDAVQEFTGRYPGQYELPEGAPVGLPWWLGWQHFLNLFFLALIVRTGWAIRTERRPRVQWVSRRTGIRSSLTVWTHQALDVLWLANGVVYIVLLFATGQWVRIVPTSWDVFPNAVSAALQYASLDWPTENGWINYNSLQQLSYFAIVFLAAPLAALTGFRMSSLWPRGRPRLDRLYPAAWARRVHFPVMLFFVGFVVVHVTLVLTTGALRNLNHVFAARDDASWVGFGVFVGVLLVIVAALLAVRDVVVAPVARLFGEVRGR